MLSQSWLNSGTPLGLYGPTSGYYVVDIEALHYGDDTEVWTTQVGRSVGRVRW